MPRRPRKHSAFKPFTPEQLAQRVAAIPVITYPDLPVSDRRDEIAAAIRDHQVVVVAGETGSGKTTQLPKICLQLGRGVTGMIGHTQPRRLAAHTVAERIAHELGQKVGREAGQVVGYQVRFTDEVGPTTLVKLMTDGILLAEIQSDPLLRRYDTLIIDEAHERSLNIDFILGYLARLLPARPDLKVIITSATIDSQRFARHFGTPEDPAPVIEVTGRTYPVDIRYEPLFDDEGDHIDQDEGICRAVDELRTEDPGDILVFLPGERDIRDTQQALADHLGSTSDIDILPLYARLTSAEQHRIFERHSRRRIVLATNVAETSLTVPGIRYVIDPGLARISRYSNRTKVQRLPIEPISQASANQRAGRCGRVANGVAIRLYSEDDFDARPEYTEPEILRTSLASVILQMVSLGLGDVQRFPFIDPPAQRAVRDGLQLLVEIGALTADHGLTAIGRSLAHLPIDPRLGRILIEGDRNGCGSDVLVIVAALSIQDVRERPLDFQQAADQAHARFVDPHSDFITYLNIWRYLNVQSRDLSGSAFRRMCRTEFLHYLRFREWRDVVGQLRDMARPLGLDTHRIGIPSPKEVAFAANSGGIANAAARAVVAYTRSTSSPDADEIHRSLLVGLLSNLGNWDPAKKEYAGTRGTRFTIWPGSGLTRSHPEWVMTAELVETSRLFARTVARIKPEWIEPLAGPLFTRVYSEPYWSSGKGAAMIHQKTMLYGLTLEADRTVLLGRLDITMDEGGPRRSRVARPGTLAGIAQGLRGHEGPSVFADALSDALGETTVEEDSPVSVEEIEPLTARQLAREMFIRHALVRGEWREHHRFMAQNRDLLEQAHEVEQRSRTSGLVAGEDSLVNFFDDLLPEGIISAHHFDRWWAKKRRSKPDLLTYPPQLLLPRGSGTDADAFPDTWNEGDLEFPLSYEFHPGAARDGVTATIRVEELPRVTGRGMDWLVPGLLDELVIETIRALPKAKRRLLAPAPEVGVDVAQWIRSRIGGDDEVVSVEVDEPEDPRSLNAAMDRLAKWGATSGSVRRNRTASAQSQPEPDHAPVVKRSAAIDPDPARRPPFEEVFADAVRQIRGVDLGAKDLAHARENVPSHVVMTLRVVDQDGRELGSGPSLTYLQRTLARTADDAVRTAVRGAVAEAFARAAAPSPALTPEPVTEFPDDVPWSVEPDATQVALRGFPALVSDKDEVRLQIVANPDEANRLHRVGVARLLVREVQLATARVTTRWSGRQAMMLAASPYESTQALVADAQWASALSLMDQLSGDDGPAAIRSRTRFDSLVAQARDLHEDRVYEILQHVIRTLEASSEVADSVRTHQHASLNEVRQEVRDTTEALVFPGFISATPFEVLPHLARYVRAGAVRLDRAARGRPMLDQDAQNAHVIGDVEDAIEQAQRALDEHPFNAKRARTISEARWLLEELRVSLFAQQLGTPRKVSAKRIYSLLRH